MLVLMKVSYPSVPYKLLFPFFPSVFYVSEFSHMCDLCCLLILKVRSRCTKSLSRLRLFATPWTAAYQAPLSMGFSRQEYWNGLPFPSPGDLPDPGIEPGSPALQTDALPSEPLESPILRVSGIK